jgi:5-formyltetrahydrofolate cyclo-ligase
MTIAAEKEAIRKTARAARARFADDLPDFAERTAHFIDATRIPPKSIVGAYVALANEADPRLLVETLAARGCEIAYPRVHMKGQPLAFHTVVPGEHMRAGAFRVPEPRPDWPLARPTTLLVPLLAFDSEGYRLGYGGGYYDRTLAELREAAQVTAVGIAFAGQEMSSLPREPNDQRLDMVVTELGVRRFSKA